ncbi:hypothetical protein U9M48_029793 [Paspalum notatum var. saurae]|uniref:Uncharacterized protein n=1 Tax=Paspalum notatum var. saurae TaxID=547442 RepID=A0AAQ3U1P6_PASNO
MASPATATTLGFLLLTANSIMAIHKSWGDAAATNFVILSYACLVLLFYCLRRFETAPPGSMARDRARVGVWLTTTLLTAMFSWRVSALMPWPVSTGVYCLRRFETAPPGPDRRSMTTKFAFITFLAWGSALATNRVGGDPASVLFVTASYYVWLLLLLCCLRAFGRSTPRSPPAWVQALTRGCRTMDRQSALGIILFAIPMCVSALAVHDVWDDHCCKNPLRKHHPNNTKNSYCAQGGSHVVHRSCCNNSRSDAPYQPLLKIASRSGW